MKRRPASALITLINGCALAVLFVFGCKQAVTPPQGDPVIPVSATPTPTAIPKPTPEASNPNDFQIVRWNKAQLRPEWVATADKAIFLYQNNVDRYTKIEKARQNGVPSQVIFVLHGRESSWNYKCHLHNGDSLMSRTTHVPKGRLPDSEPPYSFEDSAVDAIYTYEKLDLRDWTRLSSVLSNIESFNGIGYQKYHKDTPSPYLWSGTDIYFVGKYGGDGVFSPTLKDRQIGCAAIFKRMIERGIELPFR